MIWFATLLLVLPFAAVPMVFWFGVVRTAAIMCSVLLLYIVSPFLYFAVRSFEYADATIGSTWGIMAEKGILAPLVTIVAISAGWVVFGIAAGAGLDFGWRRWRGRMA